MANPLAAELEAATARLEPVWAELAGARILLTGGTGFYGSWLLESLIWAVETRGADVAVDVLTRDPDAFAARAPHLAGHRAVRLVRGDVCHLGPGLAAHTHVIHAATETRPDLYADAPLAMFDTIVGGTRAVLEHARACGARVLLASSGAVYGAQPPGLTHVPEDFPGGPDPLDARSAYGEGKRAAEALGALYGAVHGVPVVVARGWAFVGPYMAIDWHFAIGNFLRDALAGGPIRVLGDGTPYRSYLYAADLAEWLWTMLARGAAGRAYNLGSDDGRPLGEVARLVGAIAGVPVEIARAPVPGAAPARYVPATRRAADELGLAPRVPLDEAIRRTLAWHRARQGVAP